MLVIKVELWSAIDGQKSEIARMLIDNIGGTQELGDYRCRTLIGESSSELDKSMNARPTNHANIAVLTGYPRLRKHVWHLVGNALNTLGFVNEL